MADNHSHSGELGLIIILNQESGVPADAQVLLPLSGSDLPLPKGDFFHDCAHSNFIHDCALCNFCRDCAHCDFCPDCARSL